MAQITSAPLPTLAPRQINLTSILSAGVSIFSSVFSPTSSSPPATSNTATSSDASATQTSSTSSSTDTSSSPTSSSTSSRSSSISSTASAASATSSPTSSSGNHKNLLPIVLGVVLGVVLLLLLALLLCLCLRRRRKHGYFFKRGRHSSPAFDSDGESTLRASNTAPSATPGMKEASISSSEPLASPEAHHAGVAAPLAAAGITRYNDRDHHYTPLPAPHQMSSIGRRSSNEYAYPPNDPFDDPHRASAQPLLPRERRSRHSFTLDPVREHPRRERSLSDTRYAPTRRWTAGSSATHTPPSPLDAPQRTIPRKPIGAPAPTSPSSYSDRPFEHRRSNARAGDAGDWPLGGGSDMGSQYPRAGPMPGNSHPRYYSASSGSF